MPTSARDCAVGYAMHKSREEAILHQVCLGHRLHKAKIGCATFFKDVANVCYSPEHVHLAASIHIQAADGEVLLAAGSGALQEDSIASDFFLEQYHPLLDQWPANLDAADPSRRLLLGYDPLHQKRIDASITTHADDLAIKVLGITAHGLREKIMALDDALDASLANGWVDPKSCQTRRHYAFC